MQPLTVLPYIVLPMTVQSMSVLVVERPRPAYTRPRGEAAARVMTALAYSNATGGAGGASPPRRGHALLKMAQLRRATQAESC